MNFRIKFLFFGLLAVMAAAAPNGSSDSLKRLILSYFKYHGVRSLYLLKCPSNNTLGKW